MRKEAAGLQIHGYIAALGDQGPVRGAQNVFVNRRIVKDRTIAHAISEAYSVATIKERSPEVHLFIRIPPDRVDVNVHPTKAEVRFLEQSLVHEVLRRALGDALGQGRAPELQFTPFAAAPSEPQADDDSGCARRRDRRQPLVVGADGALAQPDGAGGDPSGAVEPGASSSREPAGLGTRSRGPRPPIRPMIPLGQFRDTFIIAIDDEGIAIIDQHVAHERVLFEQVMEKLTAGPLQSQRLLTPMLIELSPAQRQALIPHAATLEKFGLEIEEFGGDSVRLSAVPAVLDPADMRSRRSRARRAISRGSIAARASRTRCAELRRRWPAMPPSRRTTR